MPWWDFENILFSILVGKLDVGGNSAIWHREIFNYPNRRTKRKRNNNNGGNGRKLGFSNSISSLNGDLNSGDHKRSRKGRGGGNKYFRKMYGKNEVGGWFCLHQNCPLPLLLFWARQCQNAVARRDKLKNILLPLLYPRKNTWLLSERSLNFSLLA